MVVTACVSQPERSSSEMPLSAKVPSSDSRLGLMSVRQPKLASDRVPAKVPAMVVQTGRLQVLEGAVTLVRPELAKA